MGMGEDKLDTYIKETQKIFGKDAIFLPKFKPLDIEWVSYGIHSLDDAFGKGAPRGRIIEVYGPESSGKTTLALETIRSFQAAGHNCMFVDAEHCLDPEYAKKIGVDIDKMPISQPENGEMGAEIILSAAKSGTFGLVVCDSVVGLVPKAEIDGNVGDHQMALLAQLMSKLTRQLAPVAKSSNTTVLFTNQIRHKVGVFWGSPETQPGGNALKFYASVRADIRKVDTISDDKSRFIGITSKVKIVKNKVAPPFKIVNVDILFNKGIDRGSDLLDFLKREGKLEVRGGNYYLNEERVATGKEAALEWLKENYGKPSTAINTKSKSGSKKEANKAK